MMMQFHGRLYSVCHASILFLFGSKDYNHAVSLTCFCSLNLLSFEVRYVTSSFFAILILYSHLCLDLQSDVYSAKNVVCSYFFCMPDDLPILMSLWFFFKDVDSIELCSVISMVIGE